MFNRLSWAERRRRCEDAGCRFSGSSVFGSCEYTGDASEYADAVGPRMTQHKPRYAEIVIETDNANKEIKNLLVLVNDSLSVNTQLSSAAVDSMKDSQEIANDLARSLVMEVLHGKNNTRKLGELLQYTFAYETVLAPTRDLIYWSLATPEVVNNTLWLCKYQRDYWLKDEGMR
jgi:hypothetical protein